MKTLILKYANLLDHTDPKPITISDDVFEQIAGEIPILRHDGKQFVYLNMNDDYVEYTETREFTVTLDENGVDVFETADPENVL